MSDSLNSDSASAPVPHVYDGYEARAVRGHPPDVEQFAGVVRNGPASSGQGSDYSDARYYVDRAVAQGGANAAFSATKDSLSGVKETITATNLAEAAAGTHLVARGNGSAGVFDLSARVGRG